MKGFRTSFVGMFDASDPDTPAVVSVEIPLIQRDYAQGRPDMHAQDVRGTFVDALFEAVSKHQPIGLDFIYGEVDVDGGRFEPLDGQQRLTTLFLLHWYLAAKTGNLDPALAWTEFTYATRPSARRFCEQLVANPPPRELDGAPSEWIKDQSWYLHLWRFDPTVGAMLVMIDAIDAKFSSTDVDAAWASLNDREDPSVWFQLLPVADMGAADALYIKMNSRGKPLTPFEAFKAHFSQIIEHTGRAAEFGAKIDGPWTDLLWPYRGDNDIVDDEFMRYFDFILELCEWREGRVRGEERLRLERRAELLFAAENERHNDHLQFVFDCFEHWPTEADLETLFDSFFGDGPSAVRLYSRPGTEPNPNLFVSCCQRYGDTRGSVREFSLTDTLLLLGLLIHRIEETDEAHQRIRTLRNVNEASLFEMRVQNMPKFVVEAADYIRSGDLSALASWNQNQIIDEQRKYDFATQEPDSRAAVERLEDHPILRGTLASFELDDALEMRATAFGEAFAPEFWPKLTAALIATGEYQRNLPNSDWHLFGSPTTEGVWRSLLVDRGDRESLASTRAVVADFLDNVAAATGPITEVLTHVVDEFLAAQEASSHFDWRYYLARYDWMREGNSGI